MRYQSSITFGPEFYLNVRSNYAGWRDDETSRAAHSSLTLDSELNRNVGNRQFKKDHYGILCIPILLHISFSTYTLTTWL